MSDRINQQAADNATVGAQIGVVHGNATFYTMRPDASPAERYKIGLNYLNGNVPRKAEELIHEAVIAGHGGSDVAYHWTLSILSGRSFDHLDENDFVKVNKAYKMAVIHGRDSAGRRDEWLDALDMIVTLIQHLAEEQNHGSDDYRKLDAVLGRYAAMPEPRRDEIRRHLDMILVGTIEDLIDDHFADEIRARRKTGNRSERVPKFFQPPAAEPRLRSLDNRDTLAPDSTPWTAVGIALLAAGAVASMWSVVPGRPLVIGLVAVLWLAGGHLLARYGGRRLTLLARRAWTLDRIHPQRSAPTVIADSDLQRNLVALIDARFAAARPEDLTQDEWTKKTKSVRADLVASLTAQYGYDTSRFAPWDLDWLVTWHADRAAESWRTRKNFRPPVRAPRVPTALTVQYRAGVAAVLAGTAVAVAVPVVISYGQDSIWRTILVVVTALMSIVAFLSGGGIVRDGTITRLTRKERFRLAEEARDKAFEAEQRAYAEWNRRNTDRPSDLEMARWLDYDKVYIRNYVMRSVPLRNRDLVGHVTITEPCPPCTGARILYGPMRYSQYRVLVFLMTERGVRLFTVNLDFRTGNILNQHEMLFRYGAIAYAAADETGVHFDPGGNGRANRPDKLTFSKALRLTLTEGGQIELFVQNFDEGTIDRVQQDAAHLAELTRDAAGVDSGIRILRSIAADGADWIRQERIRRNRRLQYYREAQRRRYPEIGGDSTASTLNLRLGTFQQLPPGVNEQSTPGL